MPISIEIGTYSFPKYSVHKLTTDDELTNGQTDGRTKGQVENIMCPARLDWRTDNTVYVHCRYCVHVFLSRSARSVRDS